MDQRKLNLNQEKSFLALLDDENPNVHRALLREFKVLDKEAIQFLKKVSSEEDSHLSNHAKRFLDEILGENKVKQVRQFIQSGEHGLEKGCLLLEQVLDSSVQEKELELSLESITKRCLELMYTPSSNIERCRIINRVLFHEYGFRCNPDYQINPLNALLVQTLRRRQGFAITLSILYLLIAQRCNIKLNIINIPDYIIVGCFQDSPAFYIDTQARGSFRTADELYAILMSQNMDPHLSTFGPCSNTEILSLCCQQLVDQFHLEGKTDSANLFTQFVSQLRQFTKTQPYL